MEYAFTLSHVNELPNGEEDEKFIGVYSSQEEAERALSRIGKLPGFSENPEGFIITPYEVNKDHWIEGFFTYIPSEAYKDYLTEEGSDLLSESLRLAEISNKLKNNLNEENSLKGEQKLQEIDNNIYGIIRVILEDRLEGKDDYNLSYEVTKDNEETEKRTPTLILKISKNSP